MYSLRKYTDLDPKITKTLRQKFVLSLVPSFYCAAAALDCIIETEVCNFVYQLL